MKFVALFAFAFASVSAFAANITASVDGRQVRLPECKGTVQINNGGHNNQFNIVLRDVKQCSNLEFMDGRHYKLNEQGDDRGGSYTLLTADEYSRGVYYTQFTVTSNSGKTSDTVTVYFRVTR